LTAVPVTLRQANEFIKQHHWHSLPVAGCKFANGAVDDGGGLVGVAVAGRPVARLLDNRKTLEILRVCTDGTRNANSFLYARAKRMGQLMGYEKIITYNLRGESGASLRAIGAVEEEKGAGGRSWNHAKRERREQEICLRPKIRWRL